MTDQTNPSHGGNEHDGDAANAPAADFGAPSDQSQQFSAPAEQNPYAAPAADFGAPADQGQQFSAPAEQNPYGSAPAEQNPYGAPADQGQQFSAPAEQNPYGSAPAPSYGSAPADQGQQFSAPAEQNPYGSAPAPGYGSAPADQGQYGAPAGGYGSAPADQGQYAAPGQPNYGAPAGGQYGAPGQGGQYGAPGQPQYGAGQGYGMPSSPQDEVETAKNGHMFAGIGSIFGLGWLVAIIMYVTGKDKGPFARQELAASLNFQLSMLIYTAGILIVSSILMFVFIGFLTIWLYVVPLILAIIFAFVSMSKVSNGGSSNYPLTIKMVK